MRKSHRKVSGKGKVTWLERNSWSVSYKVTWGGGREEEIQSKFEKHFWKLIITCILFYIIYASFSDENFSLPVKAINYKTQKWSTRRLNSVTKEKSSDKQSNLARKKREFPYRLPWCHHCSAFREVAWLSNHVKSASNLLVVAKNRYVRQRGFRGGRLPSLLVLWMWEAHPGPVSAHSPRKGRSPVRFLYMAHNKIWTKISSSQSVKKFFYIKTFAVAD